MALPSVTDAEYPTPSEIRDRILSAILYAFRRRGIEANVLPGSDHFIRAEKFSARVSQAINNGRIAKDDFNPLTSTGDALISLAGVFGVTPRPAAPGAGAVTITCAGTVVIPAGWVATAPNGKKYQTVEVSTRTTGQTVDIIAIDTGLDTDQDASTILTWDDAAIGALNPKATVTMAGVTGGADADDDERLRARLLQKLSDPPVGGNASSVIEWAEDSSASVYTAYCYPAARGPGSYDVAVTKQGGDRALAAATLSIVRNYILARMPGQNDLNLTTVTQQQLDVVLAASLPLPAIAGGAGGGWRDASPWPVENVLCISYNSGLGKARFRVSSTATLPSVGASIGLWQYSATTPVMREYTIATVTLVAAGPPATYDVTVTGGYGWDPTGCYVSAGAINLVGYAAAFYDASQVLGPGEKTTLPELLPRALRRPGPDVSGPANLTSLQTAVVTNAYSEILGLDYSVRYDTGTTTTRTTAGVPATTADPPRILTVKHLAIRRG